MAPSASDARRCRENTQRGATLSNAAPDLHRELHESDWHQAPRRGGSGSFYEAAALGVAGLKKDNWIEGLGLGSRLEIHVREPSTIHHFSVEQLHRWIAVLFPHPRNLDRWTCG
jgi:hypothetical protein